MVIQVRVVKTDQIPNGIVDEFNIGYDETIDRDRPWVGGRSNGQGDTYRTDTLHQMLRLVEEELLRHFDDV